MKYQSFFKNILGVDPYPYQARLSSGSWPDLMEIPTGLGKTAAVVVAWLWRILHADVDTPRRLIYCLPMRVLVEQTRDCVKKWTALAAGTFKKNGVEPPDIDIHILMGGEESTGFERFPEKPAILIGTQDMLLSRALNRGYGMNRYRWPAHFGLLNNDCLWVIDEIQLMGAGLKTTCQLQAFRKQLGVAKGTKTLWMSATANPEWFRTIDFDPASELLDIRRLGPEDMGVVERRHAARKLLSKSDCKMNQISEIAADIAEKHVAGHRTLVVINTVDRAVKLMQALRKRKMKAELVLIHSRFRPEDRKRAVERMLSKPGDGGLIVVSTQVIEAGVDVSACVLFTEIAPWASLVQRFGRCNRAGEFHEGKVYWIDAPEGEEKFALPYEPAELEKAREVLKSLTDVSAVKLPVVEMAIKEGSILRRKDVIDLFDTTPDLSGHDIDVSRFIRDTVEHDVQVFWRDVGERGPAIEEPAPSRDEICPVPIGELKGVFMERKGSFRAWKWNSLSGEWERVSGRDDVFPGMTLLLPSDGGGYTAEEGWNPKSKDSVPPIRIDGISASEQYDSDRYSESDWMDIAAHTEMVVRVMKTISKSLSLPKEMEAELVKAVLWHDAGKAHPSFQAKVDPIRLKSAPCTPVAKAPRDAWRHDPVPNTYSEMDPRRRHFRHELASALLALAHGQGDLTAYLAAAHHGKVRLSIRSMPEEVRAPAGRRFARGVWEGDAIPPVNIGFGDITDATVLDLRIMDLGRSDDAAGKSWSERTLALRDDPALGPFRLAFFEALIKAADERASGGAA